MDATHAHPRKAEDLLAAVASIMQTRRHVAALVACISCSMPSLLLSGCSDGHAPTCTPGATRCSGQMVQQCQGEAWTDFDDCAIQGKTCAPLAGVAQCYPGGAVDAAHPASTGRDGAAADISHDSRDGAADSPATDPTIHVDSGAADRRVVDEADVPLADAAATDVRVADLPDGRADDAPVQAPDAAASGKPCGDMSGLQAGAWPMVGYCPTHAHLSPYTGSSVHQELWSAALKGFCVGEPAVAGDGTIYVTTDHGFVQAFNWNGSLKWEYDARVADEGTESSPAIAADGTIYAALDPGRDPGNIYALRPNGTVAWFFSTEDSTITSSPAIGRDGTLYVAGAELVSGWGISELLLAINPNGTKKWSFAPCVGHGYSPAIAPDGTIYCNGAGYLFAVSPEGTARWSASLQTSTSPTVMPDGTVLVGGAQNLAGSQGLYAFDGNGKRRWFQPTSGILANAALGPDGTVYVGTWPPDGQLYAVNPDGSLKWKSAAFPGIYAAPTVGADGTVYIVSETDWLVAFNPDGTVRWQHQLPSSNLPPTVSPVIKQDGTILVCGPEDTLLALGGLPPLSIDGGVAAPDADPDVPSPSDAHGPAVATGEPCSSAGECASGICAQGICCASSCTGTCMSCALPGSPGTCRNVPAGEDPLAQCADDGAASCARDGMCDGEGACRRYAAGTECAPATCAAGMLTARRVCDGVGTCQAGIVASCTPYACDATNCKTSCSYDVDCLSPNVCNNGTCIPVRPSCAGLDASCGSSGSDGCCTALAVPGGSYNRGNNASYPATVADFVLDRYEVTVGRFRAFVNAGLGTQASPPAAGAGAHPSLAGSGWNAGWKSSLAQDTAALKKALKCDSLSQTWTDTPAGNEIRPINCVTWYEAFAFCAWDEGRLPTEAEWNYAAAGGSEQRLYPWGSIAPGPDAGLAVYGCYLSGPGNGVSNIARVGAIAAGNGKWGHADLAGNVYEWTLDAYWSTYPMPCDNCARLEDTTGYRVVRGGEFCDNMAYLRTSERRFFGPSNRYSADGIRCVRLAP